MFEIRLLLLILTTKRFLYHRKIFFMGYYILEFPVCSSAHQSVHMSCKHNFSFTNEPVLIKHYTFACEKPVPHFQSVQNLVCPRSMSGKTCLLLVEILGLPVQWQVIFVKFCSIFNDVTGKIWPWQVKI